MEGVFPYVRKTVKIPRKIVKHNDLYSDNAFPSLSFLVSTRYEVFDESKEIKEEHPWAVKYYVYRMRVATRESLLAFAGYIVAHLGVFAFLFEVFKDTGAVMKACCYGQLGLLILCFVFYLGTYILDFASFFMISRVAEVDLSMKRNFAEQKPLRIMVFAVRYFECSPEDDELGFDVGGDEDIFAYFMNITFAVALVIMECLTVVYVYKNI